MRSYPDTDIDPKRDTEDSETNLGPRRYLSTILDKINDKLRSPLTPFQ